MSEKAYHILFTICWEWDFTKQQDLTLGEIIRIFYPNMGWGMFGPWNAQ